MLVKLPVAQELCVRFVSTDLPRLEVRCTNPGVHMLGDHVRSGDVVLASDFASEREAEVLADEVATLINRATAAPQSHQQPMLGCDGVLFWNGQKWYSQPRSFDDWKPTPEQFREAWRHQAGTTIFDGPAGQWLRAWQHVFVNRHNT